MSADALLSRLDRVKRTGPGRWLARCPAHADRSPSLSVREMDDSRILAHCFAGCSVEEILATVGLTFADLYPERPIDHRLPRERRPFFPTDVFEIALREITIASVIACDMHAERSIDETGYQRLLTVCGRLNEIADAGYGK